MTFLEIQKQIIQTRKARRGVARCTDYFEDDIYAEEFWNAVYKKALSVASQVVGHYEAEEQIDPKEKVTVIFGFGKNDAKETKKEIQLIRAENQRMKSELDNFREKFTRGGRKGYGPEMIAQVKSLRGNGESWRKLAKKLGISVTTAKKLYQK